MVTKRSSMDRWASALLWAGRIIAGAWALVFLVSLIGEVASGYPPGGSAFTSILNFASGGLMLLGVILSFWRPWVGGAALIVEWVLSSLALMLGLEPLADVATGLAIGAVVALLPGLLLIAASVIRRGRPNAEPTDALTH